MTSIEHGTNLKFHKTLSSESQPIDPESRGTLITFAELAQASYKRNPTTFLTSDGLSIVQGIGWDQIGVRGYIWMDNIKENVIIAFKGTSVSFPGSTLDIIPTNSENRMQVFSHHMSSELNIQG